MAGLRSIALELQIVLELHYWEQCSVAEIAAALELPEGTVKSRLRRGREQCASPATGGPAPETLPSLCTAH